MSAEMKEMILYYEVQPFITRSEHHYFFYEDMKKKGRTYTWLRKAKSEFQFVPSCFKFYISPLPYNYCSGNSYYCSVFKLHNQVVL